jgi:hypothetical protein
MVSIEKRHSPERVAIVRWAAQMGAITAEALAVREQVSIASARGRLLAATRAGLLLRYRPLAAQPALFSATRAGMRSAGVRGLQPASVGAANALHTIVCAGAAAALERTYPDHEVMGERVLRREEHQRGAPLASAVLGSAPDGTRMLHRPDLVIWPQNAWGLPVAVEVELTIKAPRRLLAICRAWARCSCVEGVLYVAPTEVRRALERAIEGAQASERISLIAPGALGLEPPSDRDPENHPR